jgi:spore maturation protein CgeB
LLITTTPRIVFVGQNWHGSNATSCKRAFRELGCDVFDIDDYHFLPRWQSVSFRALRRVLRRKIANEFSQHVVNQIRAYDPHMLFVFKGSMVKPSVIQFARQENCLAFNFYPDWNLYSDYESMGNSYPVCVPEYDCIFTPKSYHSQFYNQSGARRVEFMPYAYDPWCHFPVPLSDDEHTMFQSDVSFIGTWTIDRANTLEELVRSGITHDLAIWGGYWHKLDKNSPLRPYVKFKPAYGATQAKVFAGSKIALCFVQRPDLHTARTFEIPAYGAFMLAQRTSEHLAFFTEGKEIACFDSATELHDKIMYYLRHESERRKIAKAGFEKVTQNENSYVDRMRRVLRVYNEIREQTRL